VNGILYLTEAEVQACRPTVLEGISLARRALIALAADEAQLPPKPSVYPRPGCFANAMPAYVSDGDLLGLKFVSVYVTNPPRNLPLINGIVVICDGDTGLPRALMGAGYLTGIRTAAVSGACIQALAPPQGGHVVITGAGVQARTHLEVLDVLGYHDVVVQARRAEAAEQLVAWAGQHTPAVTVGTVPDVSDAVVDAAIIITGVPIGSTGVLLDATRVRDDALLLPLDWGTSVPAALANPSHLYADDVGQYERLRDGGAFPGWRQADGFVGAALQAPRPAGRIVSQNPGQGAADMTFADAIVAHAQARGVGVSLDR
jgi:ornithine cyclodeaminase/alanine dehydrogenase-like protein (mu-crystallin family)